MAQQLTEEMTQSEIWGLVWHLVNPFIDAIILITITIDGEKSNIFNVLEANLYQL